MLILNLSYNKDKTLTLANNVNYFHTKNLPIRGRISAFLCKYFNHNEYLRIMDKYNTLEIVKRFSDLSPAQIDRKNIIVDYSSYRQHSKR